MRLECPFDELVYDLLRLLEEGAKLPSPPSHVLVDEYQDLTSGELRLLQVLAADYGSKILVCGDDRQSIFGFRAADERALHNFPGVYNVPPEYLSRSWRCPEAICVFAEEIAKVLPALEGIERPQLIPWPEGRDPGSIRVISAGSPRGEANWVISECARLITEEGIAPCDIMVIAASYFNQVFSSLKKAVESVAALPFEFYDPRGFSPAAGAVTVRLLRAGARLLQDADDQMAWRTLVWATKGLGPSRQVDILQAGQASYLQNLQSVAGHDKVCEQVLTAGKSLIEKYKEQEEVAAKDLVTFLADQVGRSGLDLESLSALPGDLGESAPVATWVQAVIELSQKTQVAPEDRPNDIPVRTILGAKGLEAPVVFLVSAIPQSFTKFGSVADGIRRLYVAITRTKDILYISAPRSLYKSGLGSAVESNYGGLEDSVTRTAELLGISVEKL